MLLQRKTQAFDDRLPKPSGVRKPNEISLGCCQPNRVQATFDSQPIVKNDLSNSALRNYLNRATKDPFNPERSFAATANILEMEAHGKAALPKHRLAEIKEASARALKGF